MQTRGLPAVPRTADHYVGSHVPDQPVDECERSWRIGDHELSAVQVQCGVVVRREGIGRTSHDRDFGAIGEGPIAAAT